MSKIAIGLALSFGALVTVLALQDPLAAASLTASERAAGLRSVDIEVNGENCRFCRINIERTLMDVPGVRVARADMSRHRARVVYDPSIVTPAKLIEAVRAELSLKRRDRSLGPRDRHEPGNALSSAPNLPNALHEHPASPTNLPSELRKRPVGRLKLRV